MIRVIIVVDDAVVRQSLRFMLEQQPDIKVVSECTDSKQAIINQAKNLLPDILLLDLLLSDIDSVTTIREVKRVVPSVQIIALTSYYADEQILQAIKAGALSCLLKNCQPHELIEVVYAAVQGECKLHPLVATRILREVHHCKHSLMNNLTQRELDVLTYIARGCTYHEIAVELVISEQIVGTHVANILSKLQLADRTQVSVHALQQHLMALKDVQK